MQPVRPAVVKAVESAASVAGLSDAALNSAKAAAAIMGMNNVYYRATHLLTNKEYATLPARLRMNVLANPGVEKADFELWSTAVSAVNGCGMGLDAHEAELKKHGVTAPQDPGCVADRSGGQCGEPGARWRGRAGGRLKTPSLWGGPPSRRGGAPSVYLEEPSSRLHWGTSGTAQSALPVSTYFFSRPTCSPSTLSTGAESVSARPPLA